MASRTCLDARSRLGADLQRVIGFQSDRALDFFQDAVRLCGREIDFVEDRNNLEVVFQREVRVRHRLGFHSLRGVHHQQGPFAGCEAP